MSERLDQIAAEAAKNINHYFGVSGRRCFDKTTEDDIATIIKAAIEKAKEQWEADNEAALLERYRRGLTDGAARATETTHEHKFDLAGGRCIKCGLTKSQLREVAEAARATASEEQPSVPMDFWKLVPE